MNYFVLNAAAERYNQFRPPVHQSIIERIELRCSESIPFESALDVGCGTGHSTYALQKIAKQITGIDPSPAMLAQTRAGPGIQFLEAVAEHLPFPDNQFDLISVGLAFHWLDQGLFLSEAKRVLRPGGWLIIYNSWMIGRIEGIPSFADWVQKTYLKRFPSPPRNQPKPVVNDISAFDHISTDTFEVRHAMSANHLANYLTTQSNITRYLMDKQASVDNVLLWLEKELDSFYVDQKTQDIPFGCLINGYRLNK